MKVKFIATYNLHIAMNFLNFYFWTGPQIFTLCEIILLHLMKIEGIIFIINVSILLTLEALINLIFCPPVSTLILMEISY